MGKAYAPEERGKIIIRTSIIGILANVALAGFKAAVGLLSHSIAIVLDAVNNLSDALSSVITIAGTRLAAKAPDRKHPLGHGRVEYLTASIIAVIVLYAGITSLIESVKKIIHPDVPEYTAPSLIIVGVAVVAKILMGRYVSSVGKAVNSGSLEASGKDATLDAIISASTLAAALIYIFGGLSLEAWLGTVISVIIIKAGVDMLRETISQIIGERVDSDLSRDIKKTISGFEGVNGAYDLVLHSYGPDILMGSVHVEVPDSYTASQIDKLTRQIQKEVYAKHSVILTAVGVYSMNTTDPKAIAIREHIDRLTMDHKGVLQMHGFYLDEEQKTMTFDLIFDFAYPDRQGMYKHILDEVRGMYPDYDVHITMDADISD
ncbi:MAG: cation diffusion facilitator family transporter [Clostridia bacterium]|nr:cation diffusion facilitator family transporter [Clostridia bacterium]